AVGVEVVAGPRVRVHHRHGIAHAPEGLVAGGIVGARDPHGAAAGAPGVVLVLPGFAARFAGRRDGVLEPELLAAGRLDARHPVTHAGIAAGGADDDLVLDRQRRAGDAHLVLAVDDVGLPHDLAALLVGRDDACRAVGGRDHKVAPEGRAAIGG